MGPIGRFAPPLVLMALIFFLSAQPDLNSGLGWIDHVGRKLVHMAEYALLCRADRILMPPTAQTNRTLPPVKRVKKPEGTPQTGLFEA